MKDQDLLRLIWISTCNLYRATITPAGDKFLAAAFAAMKSEQLPIPDDHVLALRKKMRELAPGDIVVDISAGSHKDAVGKFVAGAQDETGDYNAVALPQGHIVRWRDKSTVKVLEEIIWLTG